MWMGYTGRIQKIPVDGTSRISAITILTKEHGAVSERTLLGEDIPKELEADLLQCIGQYSMTSTPISVSEPKSIPESYRYLSLWIHNADGTSLRINVFNAEGHSSVQLDERHFGIIDSGQMLADMNSAGKT